MVHPRAQGLYPTHGPTPSAQSSGNLRKKCGRNVNTLSQGKPIPPTAILALTHSVCCPSMPTDCHKSCLTCSSSGTCTTCQKGLRMNPHGSCLANKKCGPSEYWDEDAPRCKPCHTKCFHCTGPAEDQCQTCPRVSLLLSELLLLRGGLCVSLPLGNCLAHCLVW